MPHENPKNQGFVYKHVPKITEARQHTLDILNKPRLPSEYIPQNQLSTQVFPSSSQRSRREPTSPSMESDGEDMRQLLQEINTKSSSNTIPETSEQANMVTNIGLAPTNEPNTWLSSILLPREPTQALPFDSDEERLQ